MGGYGSTSLQGAVEQREGSETGSEGQGKGGKTLGITEALRAPLVALQVPLLGS